MTEAQIRETMRYHSPGVERVKVHEAIREHCTETAVNVAALIRPSRERSLFLTKMQEAQMMANAALAIHGRVEDNGTG